MKSGGSPIGRRQPPQLHTMKMKKTTECALYFRSRIDSRSGRISTIAAPVVPTKLAMSAPTRRMVRFSFGRPSKGVSMRRPPAIT